MRLTVTVCQSSYPLKSENGSPFGTVTVYLSCAEIALPAKTTSTTVMRTNVGRWRWRARQ